MADNTKCTPKGIVQNLLVKIDKFVFPVDFVILDMIEDFKMPIILGRPLLAMAHAKVDIFRTSISLEVGNEIVIFKMSTTLQTHMPNPDIFTYDIDVQESYEEAVYRMTKREDPWKIEKWIKPIWNDTKTLHLWENL
ncbi:zinc knuckle CX2CX4HX4C containing protein, partial [Tanacetum coccineum]